MQLKQLIPKELLQKSDKILFLTHLALGDFTYMQNCFKALHQNYPHLKIDVWVDEQRGKPFWRRFKKNSGKYVLYDWMESCSFINKVYRYSGSRKQTKNFIKDTKKQNYPIIVSLGTLRSVNFAKFAILVSNKSFTCGIRSKTRWFNFIKNFKFKQLTNSFVWQDLNPENNLHISKQYANCFKMLFGLEIEEKRLLPFIDFPRKWLCYGKLKFLKWGIYNRKKSLYKKVIFINTFAKNKRRCWSIDKAIKLIQELKKLDRFYDSSFIINVLPNQQSYLKKRFKGLKKQNVFLFSADVNFFQLPSIIKLCDLVISAETSIIHLAAALKVPVISLMRQKNLEWIPIGTKVSVVSTKKRKEWVKHIGVDEVSKVVGFFGKELKNYFLTM